jgi:hypothetical protein
MLDLEDSILILTHPPGTPDDTHPSDRLGQHSGPVDRNSFDPKGSNSLRKLAGRLRDYQRHVVACLVESTCERRNPFRPSTGVTDIRRVC